MMLIKHTWLLILHVRVSIKAGLFDSVLLQSTQVCVNQIPRWKDISIDFREAAVFAHQPGRVIRPITLNLKATIMQRKQLFTSGKHLSGHFFHIHQNTSG
ncbi:hypothetical protein AMECASPLE_001458 [Ameca splendens]|uniref:Secreted protein n=1 Tax=Ameca splendens TaxID=208324 RepID=A0ABV0XB91_9TELE